MGNQARLLLAVVLLPIALSGCGKKNAAVLPDSWEVSLARAGEAWIAKDMPRAWALCENAFAIASKASKLDPALTSLDCLGEVAVKQGEATKSLPFAAKFIAAYRAAEGKGGRR